MMRGFEIILFGALVVLLARVVWRDLAVRTISNRLNGAVAALALASWWAEGLSLWPGVALQIGLAAIVFGLFTIAFALRMMGGGDVKLLTALALWRVPPLPGEPMFAALIDLLTVMAIAGGVLTLVMLIRHRRSKAEGQPEVPYGVAIALGALLSYAERYLNHFS
jgi:prepilin peptidase CpaA